MPRAHTHTECSVNQGILHDKCQDIQKNRVESFQPNAMVSCDSVSEESLSPSVTVYADLATIVGIHPRRTCDPTLLSKSWWYCTPILISGATGKTTTIVIITNATALRCIKKNKRYFFFHPRKQYLEDAPKRILFYKPMGWLGQIRPHRRDESWSAGLGQTFFSTSMGAQISFVPEKPLTVCGCHKFRIDTLGDHLYTCTTHSGAKKAHDWLNN